jgi:hypothetical protein
MPEKRVRLDPPHHDMWKTLSLLSLQVDGKPLFFVVEGCCPSMSDEKMQASSEYLYEEHNCPTNFIPVVAIVSEGNDDVHGLFEHVRSVWMPADFDRDDSERLFEMFPEMKAV